FLALRFFAAAFIRLFVRAGAAFLAFLPLAFLAFFAFAFFAMIDLPIVRLPLGRAPTSSGGAPCDRPFCFTYGPTAPSDRTPPPRSRPRGPRPAPPGAQSDQRDGITPGASGARRDLGDAADIAGGDHIGTDLRDACDLAIAQRRRELRLQQVVGAGRAAAEMA